VCNLNSFGAGSQGSGLPALGNEVAPWWAIKPAPRGPIAARRCCLPPSAAVGSSVHGYPPFPVLPCDKYSR
jgi:hypothetical protein